MKTNSPRPFFSTYALPIFLLIIAMGVASPFLVNGYKNRQLRDNETAVVQFIHAYSQAQELYFAEKQEYAQSFQKMASFAQFKADMDDPHSSDEHGYRFRILTAQGASAPGGAKSYIDDHGRMTLGFGLMAAPGKYGFTGRHTFLISAQNRYAADLGVRTRQITENLRDLVVPPEARVME